ncbi:MFS transporter [Vibrio algarum]|uniref:MFS transporter n=1 Tax=Vibrio algarum TaxID=3020714 RepID=A0ABT4YPC9_9VIBR|nr:MFS transporter [Vibrio sp. KJ40-1]MDB1123409.1 MFS transporter [Vibrio sp. KJ40-1]
MSKLLKPAILSLSLLTVMSGAAVAPALAEIQSAFPDTSQTTIKLILTVPAISIIIFSLVSGRLSRTLSKRTLLFIGIFFYLLGGLGGGLANSIEMLLAFRAVLGIGVGLIMPMSTGLIADLFSDKEKATMMGYSTASSNLGGIIATLLAGVLASVHWRYSFGVYSIGLLVFSLVFISIPETRRKINREGISSGMPLVVFCWAVATFFLSMTFYTLPVNLAIYIKESGMGSSTAAGVALSVSTGSGFVAGILYSKVKVLLGRFLPAFLCGLMATGFYLLSFVDSYSLVLMAVMVVGFGLGWSMPTLFMGATKAGGEGNGVQTMSVVSSTAFLGQFMSPVVFDYLGKLAGNDSIQFTFSSIAILFTFFFVVCLTSLYYIRSPNQEAA